MKEEHNPSDVLPTVTDILPHRGRMLLVDRLESCDPQSGAVAWATVKENWPTQEEGTVDVVLMVEVIAQTANLLVAWMQRHSAPPDSPGMLVGVREARFFYDRVAVASVLRVHAQILQRHEGYAIVEGSVHDGRELLCAASIQAYQNGH